MGDFGHDSRSRPATPEHIEGHGLATGYEHPENPNSPTYNPAKVTALHELMADPIDSAL
jgi:hypothetical protein